MTTFDALSRNTAVAMITGYQKFLSPHKGFSCAHRILYGEESCSQYVKRAVREHGLRQAVLMSRDRFQACKTAHQILRSRFSQEEDERDRIRRNADHTCNTCLNTTDCASMSCEAATCLGENSCSSLHCGALDCGGLDCGVCDVGGCSW